MFPSSLFYIARVTKNEKILFTTLKLCVNILDLQLSDLVKTKFDKIVNDKERLTEKIYWRKQAVNSIKMMLQDKIISQNITNNEMIFLMNS